MVRKYNPDVETEWANAYNPNSEYSIAVMVESPYGEWVKLETYEDETKRLRAMIHRLEERNTALEEDIKLGEANQLQLLEMLKP